MSDQNADDAVRPWRVLMIGVGTPDRHREGGARRFLTLVDELPETRAVIVDDDSDPENGRIRAVSRPSRLALIRLGTSARAITAEADRADIIDIHSPSHAFLPLILRVFRDKPITVHADPERLDARAGAWGAPLRRRLRSALDGHVYRRATIVIAPTGAAKRVLVEDFGVAPWSVKVLTTGVDATCAWIGDRDRARERLSIGPDVFVACAIRPLVSRQGLRILLDAWSKLVAERALDSPASRHELLIGGGEMIDGSLERELAASAFSGTVRVLGEVTEEHLADLYRVADVQVIPSRPAAGRGRVVLEAATCGTPSIVALAGGLSDPLGDLDETLIVAVNDPAALTRRLAAADEGALPNRASTREWAKRHRLDLASQHRAIYDGLLERSRRDPRKLRVAYIGHVAQLSGGEIALTRLIDALPDVEPHVILAEDGPLVGRLLAAGVSVEVLPMRARTRELRKDRINPHLPFAALADASLYTLRLARRLRAIRPDIVHTNTLKGGVYGSLAARLAGIPSVWHVRDRIARDYLPRSAVVVLRRLIAKIPNGVIANSESTRSTLRSPPERTLVMHSIIHDPVSAPRPKAGMSHRGPLVVGMVGRLARWKGQHVFLAAFADAFGDGDARAIVVGSAMFGDAEKRYAKELHAQVAGLGIGERVEFRGFRHDVWSELADMDVLVHASITPEPFGQVIVEAMLAGVPVIAAAGGGPSEIVTDGVDGLLYPPGNVKALSAALTRLASDPELREQLSVSARRRAAAFSPEAAAAGAMSMYSRVLKSGRAGV